MDCGVCMKKMMLVLAVVREGCETSAEVGAVLGWETRIASAYLSDLRELGLVRVVKPRAVGYGRGPRSHVYGVV